MTTLHSASAPVSPTGAVDRLHDANLLLKPRLNALVLMASAVGFTLGWRQEHWPSVFLVMHTLAGTALCAMAGSIINQWLERDTDGLMARTADRPLPQQRLQPSTALRLGVLLGVLGVAQIALLAQRPLAGTVAFATILTYALIYTPMKKISSTSTLLGAVPGALPPLIGWAAAAQELNRQAWSIFLIMLVWQMPHFFAIAWRYRDEYASAGIPVMPATESDGLRTAARTLSWSALLIPVSLLPERLGLVGPAYLYTALLLGVVQLCFAIALVRHRESTDAARRLFLYSLMYLPALFTMMVVDRMLLPMWLGG